MKRLFTMLIVLSMAFSMAWAQNDLDLTFEDNTDLANWSHHDEANVWTSETWDATAGMDGTGGLVFTDGGYTFLVKRPVTVTAGANYVLSIDIYTPSFAGIDVSLEVEGLSTDVPKVMLQGGATGFITYRLAGMADLGTSGYIRLHSLGSTETPTMTIDNVMFNDDVPGVFFSEYAEGSGNNKYVEIYNGTGADLDLAGFSVQGTNNGTAWGDGGDRDVALTGTLLAGDVYILAADAADALILAEADLAMAYESPMHHNGDDGIALLKDGVIIDAIGVDMVDPGDGWDVAGVTDATKDHVLIRKAGVIVGNANWGISAGTDDMSSEWIVMENDDWINLGSHPYVPPMPVFFSEYAEGSGSNKYVEIYNGTGADLDLAGFSVQGTNNGTAWGDGGDRDIALTGTLLAGDVYILAADAADAPILAEADLALAYESPMHHNGDDGIALLKDGVIIDVIGVDMVDPGDGWDVAGVVEATKDHVLIRKAEVVLGNPDWALSAGTDEASSEWIVMEKDDWSNLGMHPLNMDPWVHFEVNMAHQILKANFDPASDYVDVAGDMNGWGPGAGEWQLTAHPDTNGIWVGDFQIPPGEYGFKFRINSSWDAGKHDGGDNRMLYVGDMGGHYFGYLDHYTHYPVIFFGVDLGDKFALGEFDPTVDSVNVIGSFNGWGTGHELHPMMDDGLKWGAYLDDPTLFTANDNLEFKFRINQNWDNGESISNRKHTVTEGLQEYKAFWNDYDYNLAVTFEVNMNAKIAAGEFDPATQVVDIPGNFNGWSGTLLAEPYLLSDPDGDGIWSTTVTDSFVVGQELEFKFRIDGDWGKAESDPNRKYIVGGGAQKYYDWWNRFDPDFVGAPVTFKVNMNAQIDASLFTAGTDNVMVTGVFGAIPMDDGDADGIYEATANIPLGLTFYRFRINDDTPENLPFDRSVILEVPDTPVVLDVVWFSNVAEVRTGSGNITFRVDMNVLQGLGFYDRALGDSLELRGGVNGWGSDPDRTKIDMIRQPGTEIYFLTVPFTGDAGEVFSYKFFLNLHQTAGGDSAQHAGEDFFEYELPAGVGGGDRFFVWSGMDGDTVLPVQTFQDYVTEGIVPAGETVHGVLYMDMSEAMHYEDNPFDPATDSLYFIWQDAWGAELQGLVAGNLAEDKLAYLYHQTWQSMQLGEYVYEVTIPIAGPAPHALMYTTRYVKPDGLEVDEEGAGYGFGRFRTQWLKPETVGGSIAAVQGLEVVKFSNLGVPLEVFPEPYANGLSFANPVSTGIENLPTSFALSQNYPNPFNPTTTISYVIPEAVNVELIVFDITGREVTRLVDNRSHNAGRYDVMWNGLNESGERVASGLYFYRIMAGDFQQTNKMLMLK